LAAQDQVELAIKVPGRVAELSVDLGDHVSKGQRLARLDPTDLDLAVRQAEAALGQARVRLGLPQKGSQDAVIVEETPLVRQSQAMLGDATLNRDRAQQMFDQALISRADYDSALAQFQVADSRYNEAVEEIRNRQAILAQRRSDLQLALQMRSYADLTSPIDGAVLDRQASVGQYLPSGDPVLTIVRIHPLRLRLPIPERAAADVQTGQKVYVRLDQDSSTYEGRVARISPAIDPANRTQMIEAEVPNPRGLLPAGAFARAQIVTKSAESVLMIPASSVVTFAGIQKVLTVEDDRASERPIEVGRTAGDRIEVLSGLTLDDQVIVEPSGIAAGQLVAPSR
jgi:RND family efflux transporter MFP subunit